MGTCITAAVLAVAAAGIWRSEGRGGTAAGTITSAVSMAVMPATPPLATLFIVASEEEAGALLAVYEAIIDAAGNPVSIGQVLVVKNYEDAVRAQQVIEDARARLGSALQVIDRRPAASGSSGFLHGAGDGPSLTP